VGDPALVVVAVELAGVELARALDTGEVADVGLEIELSETGLEIAVGLAGEEAPLLAGEPGVELSGGADEGAAEGEVGVENGEADPDAEDEDVGGVEDGALLMIVNCGLAFPESPNRTTM